MFPTFISILDIQSWWEVPSIAHFCSLFRTAFNLLDFDIEDLEEALLTDGTEETSWLQELIVRLLSGCLPNNEISTFNYQMFLRRLFRQKCQEHDRYNPFNTDCDFTLLPLRTKVDILHALCDFRLDAEDVLDQLKNLEADSLRVEPLGYDKNDSAYWYFYGTRLYREDFQKKNNKKKAVWQVICFTEDDWFQLTKKFKSSGVKNERALYHTLSKNFLPELPRLFKEKERQARRRLLENQPRRTSDRIRKLDVETVEREERTEQKRHSEEERQDPVQEQHQRKKEQDNRRRESYEKRSKLKELSEESHSEPEPEARHEMASKKRGRSSRQRKISTDSSITSKEVTPPKRKKTRASERHEEPPPSPPPPLPPAKPTVGRQTNNSLSALDGQIVIQQGAPPAASNKKKLKTSQVFQQTDEDLLVGMHKILDFVKNHDDAWPFLDPVEEEYAPNYYSIIRRPMDLTRMEDRLDQGYYKNFDKFKDDFQLIVNNCRLYNGAENEYTQMVDNLVKVFEKATERYLDQISSSDEEIAVENLNSEGEAEEETKPSKQQKKKKHSAESSPTRTSTRGRKPALVAQGKKRERSPSRETSKSVEEEIVQPKPKKSKKQEKESKKEEKQSRRSDRETRESKRSDRETRESKKNDRETRESKRSDRETRESKRSDKESKKSEKESKKSDKEPKKAEKESKKESKKDTKKVEKETKKIVEKESKKDTKKSEKESKKVEEKESKKQGKNSKSSKKESKLESKKENKTKDKEKKPKKRGRKKKKVSPIPSRTHSKSASSRSPSPSPPRSLLSTPPPSSPEGDLEDRLGFGKEPERFKEDDPVRSTKTCYPWETPCVTDDTPPPSSPLEDKLDGVDKKVEDLPPYTPLAFSFKPAKDKHNKLRETIEKLKAKSEINRLQTPVYDFEVDDHLKENKDKNKKSEEKQHKVQHKEKSIHANNKAKKNHHHYHPQEQETDAPTGNTASQSDIVAKKSSKKKDKDHHHHHQQQPKTAEMAQSPASVLPKQPVKQSNFEALSLATEQTLKDINKWLDDTPKFADFSSASNSPSYLALDDFDLLGTPRPLEPKKVVEKPSVVPVTAVSIPSPVSSGPKKEPVVGSAPKEGKKKPFRDPSKFFNKRREVQRTIDRLQPGKSKGNLITNVQSATKTDEIFPLGPLSKMKDTKNSLIVKTDTNAPKLSLGSVLDSFGKHKFVVDDQKKEEEEEKEEEKREALVDKARGEEENKKTIGEEVKKEEKEEVKQKVTEGETKIEKDVKETKPTEEPNSGGPTPNLSAWFKAFGAPKAPPPQKKPEKTDSKEEEIPAGAKSERVPPGDPSPSLESPQPITRQRRISTGSSMSERSSFSQDLDSPRVGMEERGAYPAPYPSPLHRSPSSGASPVMASPRPDISPRSPYPFNGGQMRVGFYQDTVASSKSSPDKSCSPRENPPNSPYYQPTGPEHVYAPNTTQAGYSASYTANSPYYTHPPNYSSTNPTPPYNMDGSSNAYYDTSKIVDQYQSKPSQNYTANSPASSQASPAPQPQLSPHSPIVHHPQTSPSIHSPSIHSPNVQSPSMHSPSLHSPSMHSPSVHSSQHSHSPQLPSPGQSLHSPGMSVVSPQVNSPGVQHSPMALSSPSMAVNSPMNPASVETFHAQQDESSNGNSNGATTILTSDGKDQATQQETSQQPVFPVKKRAFLDTDLSSQFAALQEEMLASRNLQVGHQLARVPPDQDLTQVQAQHHLQQQEQLQKHQQEQLQKHQQHLQKQQIQEAQEQLLQKHQQLQKQQLQEAQDQMLQKHQQLQKQQLQEAQEQMLHKHQQQLQEAQEQLLQKHQQQLQKQQLQEAQEQILQQAQAQLQQQQKSQQMLQQQQKNQQLLQQQKSQQPMLQEQQKAQQQQQLLQEQKKQQQQQLLQEQKQHQLLQEQKQQQLLQQQKNLQLLQQQAMAAAFGKAASSSDQSLRTPSPPVLSQQQQASVSAHQQDQRSQQQVVAHSGSESSSSSIRSLPYPTSTSSQYNPNFGNRESYPLNVPTARSLQSPHQQKLDMSKFTNMGYSGPEVNFSRALQQQYSRPELSSYTRTTVQSAISQASQLLNSQALSTSQPSASSASSLPGYQKSTTNQQQAHSSTYQSGRSVDSVAERLAAQAQQEAAGYKQDSRSTYNSTPLDLEQALGLSRNLSNIVDRYSNEQRMMAGLQSASNPYYTDKGLGTPHMFNKQIFSQSNMAAMGYGQQQQQQAMQQQSQTTAQSLYGRQMAGELQSHELKSGVQAGQANVQERKQRKKKSGAKAGSSSDSSSSLTTGSSSATPGASSSQATPTVPGSAPQQHGFQSYAGLKASPAPSSGSTSLDPAAIALKSSSVPGSAFNFGSGALGMSSGLSESYPNLLDEFRGTSNYFMGGANAKPGQSGQGYPPFLNPAAHQGRSAAYPLGGPFMDTSSQLYQHYLQAGVLNQGLLGAAAAGGYPPGYHAAALAMRQPYDSMSRPSWL